jgi:outer membrane scaffolding protein for murein synthesis (MipA/OmpV family)
MFFIFLLIDYCKTHGVPERTYYAAKDAAIRAKLDATYRLHEHGTMITTPGFEMLGSLAQDGPTVEESKAQSEK